MLPVRRMVWDWQIPYFRPFFLCGYVHSFCSSQQTEKRDSNTQLLIHTGSRTLALLIMGLFLVNGENINAAATGMPKVVWYSLSCISFILIWNMYLRTISPWFARTLQAVGIAILLTLAFVYRGGEGDDLNRLSISFSCTPLIFSLKAQAENMMTDSKRK